MTTDDAPRPALDAGTVEEGRKMLARASDGPWMVRDDMDGDDDHTWYFPVGIAQEDPSFPGIAGDPVIAYAEFSGDCERQMDTARAIVWLRNHADALLAAAAERDALAREAARLRRAVVLALDGPSDGEIGMETTLGRLNRIERQLRAALAPQEGDGNGR